MPGQPGAVRARADADGHRTVGDDRPTYSRHAGARRPSAPVKVPVLSELPILGRALFSQNVLVYLIYIILPVAVHFIIFRTRHGLNMRAVGENPAAADAAGISVQAIRFWYVAVGSALAAAAAPI